MAKAERDADALEGEARELEHLAALADKYGLTLVEKPAGANGAASTEPVSRVISVTVDINGPAYKAAINASENAIRAAGHPLELSELFDACESLGVKLGGQRPQSTLSAYLAHSKSTVESIRKGVYWLKGVPTPH